MFADFLSAQAIELIQFDLDPPIAKGLLQSSLLDLLLFLFQLC